MSIISGVHNASPENWLLDEILLAHTDGHCVYDDNFRLLTWSESFESYYPQIMHLLHPGVEYREILRYMIEYRSVINFPLLSTLESLEAWLDEQVAFVRQKEINNEQVKYNHKLCDGRTIRVQQIKLSNGQRFFAARDITESVAVRSELKASADKFSQFAEIASDWFWELDENLRYCYHSTHKDRLTRTSSCAGLQGLSRIEEIEKSDIILNDQLAEHNRCLRAHEPVDVVLSSRAKDNQEVFAHIKALPRFKDDGTFSGYIGCGQDVTEIFGMQKKLSFYSSHDDLTGLINRRTLMDFLASSISTFQQAGNSMLDNFSVAQLDLDHFKIVNDEAGHQVGDLVLKQFSSLVQDRLPARSHLSRLGSDEFVALIPGSGEDALAHIQDLISYVADHRFEVEGRCFSLSISVGLVEPCVTEDSPSSILHRADVACYSAKLLGRNRAELYSPDNKFQARQNKEISSLKIAQKAISSEMFQLYLQPITKANGAEDEIKFEVLLRFFDNQGNILGPGDIIPVAERYDLMQELDLLVLRKSLNWIGEFMQHGCAVSLSVNLSGATLGNQQYLDSVSQVLLEASTTTRHLENLCIEITETAAMQNVEVLQRFILTFQQLGCKFSLDDFGTGLASFKYLKSLPVDFLKIDGSFITNIIEDEASQAIVKSFNTLAHELGMQTVGECVENNEISSYLETREIDYLQGYGIGVPEAIEVWFERLSKQAGRMAS